MLTKKELFQVYDSENYESLNMNLKRQHLSRKLVMVVQEKGHFNSLFLIKLSFYLYHHKYKLLC